MRLTNDNAKLECLARRNPPMLTRLLDLALESAGIRAPRNT